MASQCPLCSNAEEDLDAGTSLASLSFSVGIVGSSYFHTRPSMGLPLLGEGPLTSLEWVSH